MKSRLNINTANDKSVLSAQLDLFVFSAIASTLVSTGILAPSVKISQPIVTTVDTIGLSTVADKTQLIEIPLNPALQIADAQDCGRFCNPDGRPRWQILLQRLLGRLFPFLF
jgi:hypothetical protein